ncbi:unnamed protein product [Arabidopsis lyrata]|nr:unnamed protein product [Arabidopsis lyrata]
MSVGWAGNAERQQTQGGVAMGACSSRPRSSANTALKPLKAVAAEEGGELSIVEKRLARIREERRRNAKCVVNPPLERLLEAFNRFLEEVIMNKKSKKDESIHEDYELQISINHYIRAI